MILNPKLDTFLNKFPYLFERGKTSIYSPDGLSKFEVRQNTSDKVTVWEAFKLKAYYDKELKIKSKDIVVDIGGNIGSFAVWAAQQCLLGHVFVYEPFKPSFDQLQKNLSLNKLHNVSAFNKAVTSSDGFLNLYVNEMSPVFNSSFKTKFVEKEITVPKISLENVLKENNLHKVDFLKIDVEGSEYDIILNSPSSVFKKVEKIYLEYHTNKEIGIGFPKLVAKLQAEGFITNVKRNLFTISWGETGYIKAYKN
ncbi:MAG: FkbM family methyltransferase [Patescibacteria group bacterium]